MKTWETFRIFMTAAALLAAPSMALAQDAISAPAQKKIGSPKSEMVPSLAVLNSRGASLQGDTLTLAGVAPNSIIFADRPVRAAGHVLTKDFLKEWDEGADSFAKDPECDDIGAQRGWRIGRRRRRGLEDAEVGWRQIDL